MDPIIKERRLDEIANLMRHGLTQREAAKRLSIPTSTFNDRYKLIKTKYPYLLNGSTPPENFIFHRSYYDTYKHLQIKSPSTAVAYLESILEYGLNNKTPDESAPFEVDVNFPVIQFQFALDRKETTL